MKKTKTNSEQKIKTNITVAFFTIVSFIIILDYITWNIY